MAEGKTHQNTKRSLQSSVKGRGLKKRETSAFLKTEGEVSRRRNCSTNRK